MLIEAAMMGINMAPGLNREFISEKWRTLDKKIWWDTRKDAFETGNCAPNGIYLDQFILLVFSNNSSNVFASNSATLR